MLERELCISQDVTVHAITRGSGRMIWESTPWKDGLLSDADKLASMNVANEQAAVEFEKTIFIAAIAIRKLMEAKKLTDSVASVNLKCTRVPLRKGGRIPDLGNWHRVDEFYDYTDASDGTITLRSFTNQLIHSYIFGPITADAGGKLVGFFVTSDTERKRHLYEFDIDEIIKVLRLVGNDHVVRSVQTRDADGQWIVKNYGPDDPEIEEARAGQLAID